MRKIANKNLLFFILILSGLIQYNSSWASISASPSLTINVDKTSDCVQSGNSSNVNFSFTINNPQGGVTYWFRLHFVVGGNETTPADFDGSITSWVATPSASGYYYGELFNSSNALIYTTGHIDFNLTTIDKPNVTAPSSACLTPSGDGFWDFKVNNYDKNLTYKLYINSPVPLTDLDGKGNFRNDVHDGNAPGNSRTYKVRAYSGASCYAESDPIVVNFKANTIHEKAASGSEILVLVKYSEGQYNLVNDGIFSNLTQNPGATWSFTGPTGIVFNSSQNKWVINPTSFNSGDIIDYNQIGFTVNYNGCVITDKLKFTKFKIIDDKAALPPFLGSLSSLPICENSYYWDLYASINPNCLTNPSAPITITLTYKDYNGVPGVTNRTTTAYYWKQDPYSTNNLYYFYIEPKYHVNNNIHISIAVNSCTPSLYSDDIPIYPSNTPTFFGIPPSVKENNRDFVHLCSASNDTVSLRPNPSGGNYYFYLYKPNGLSYNFVKSLSLSNLTYDHSNLFPPEDPSLIKFIPSQVFKEQIQPNGNDYVIRIIYYGPPPCPASIERYFKFDAPVATTFIKPKDTICFGDTLNVSVTPLNNLGSKFLWNFGDEPSPGYVLNDTIEKHFYSEPGMYFIRFKTDLVSLPSGACNNDVIDTIWVGAKPKADFNISNNFKGYKAKLSSRSTIPNPNTSVNNDLITSWTWKLGNGDIINNALIPDTAYTYANFLRDPYPLTHIVTTHWGCTDSIQRFIPIFPVKTPTVANPVNDEFNISDVNGWYHSGQYKLDTVSSWLNITPNSPTIKGGTEAWITAKNNNNSKGNSGYFNDEKSHVDGPAYDVSGLQLPMVSFDTWKQLDNYFDGVALQYAFVDNIPFGKETWHTLGQKDIGLNWYNSNSIISNPGGSFDGWTDTSNNWQLSAYSLKEIKDSIAIYKKTKIRFRFVIGANKGNAPGFHDGFAFDNFFVGERNRRVIVEEFCDMNHTVTGIDQIYEDPQGINIQYHVNTLANDTVYNQNPAEPSARALYYGVGTGLPRGVIDGVLEKNDKSFQDWGVDDFFRRSLIISPFNIAIDPLTVSNGKLMINANVTKVVGTPTVKNPLVVQVGVLDTKVTIPSGGGNPFVFKNVLRNYLPNAAGNRVDQNINWGTSAFNVSHTWQPLHKPDSAIIVVVFVQDENTKEIYQSQKMTLSAADAKFLTQAKTAVVNAAFQPSFNEMYIAPNPTSGDLKVVMNGIVNETYTWRVLDELGLEVKSGIVNHGTNALFINTEDLRNGMYVLSMEGEGQRIVKKFSVIK